MGLWFSCFWLFGWPDSIQVQTVVLLHESCYNPWLRTIFILLEHFQQSDFMVRYPVLHKIMQCFETISTFITDMSVFWEFLIVKHACWCMHWYFLFYLYKSLILMSCEILSYACWDLFCKSNIVYNCMYWLGLSSQCLPGPTSLIWLSAGDNVVPIL